MYKRIYFDRKSGKIHLWESDENGQTFLIEDRPNLEYYIEDDSNQSNIKDIFGKPQIKKIVKSSYDLKKVIDSGVKTCEAGFSQEIKYLQNYYFNKPLVCNIKNFQVATIDIELASGDRFDDNTVDNATYPINLITVYFSKKDQYYTFGLQEYTGTDSSIKNYYYCKNESILLSSFMKCFKAHNVDIFTGWNIEEFDIPYLINRCNLLQVKCVLSPLGVYTSKVIKSKFGKDKNCYKVAGLNVLDGMRLYEKFNQEKLSSYSLNAVGLHELDEGKLDFEGQINTLYKTDWNRFVEYNIQDVKLCVNIEKKKKFINLAIQLCYDSLIPFENCFSAISLGTGSMLLECHKNDMVLNDVDQNAVKTFFPGAYTFAKPGIYKYVMSYDFTSMYPHLIMQHNISPETLRYRPENKVDLIKTPVSDFFECETPNGHFEASGIYYDSSIQGFLSSVIKKKFQERKYFNTKFKISKGIDNNIDVETIAKNLELDLEYCKKLYDEIKSENYGTGYYYDKQYTLKINLNSYFGILGNKSFSLYNLHNAIAITASGQYLIRLMQKSVNDYFKTNWNVDALKYYNIENVANFLQDISILTDTDSCYFNLEPIVNSLNMKFNNDEEFASFARDLDKKIFKPLFEKVLQEYADKFNTKQLMNFKREKIISNMMIVKRKNYATIVIDSEGTIYNPSKMFVTGLSIVKSSSPIFARQELKTVLRFLIESRDKMKVINKLKEIKKQFEIQEIENISFFIKVNDITKWVDDFGNPKLGTPQQVKAAICYNKMIKEYNLKLQPITDGNHIKFVKVHENNELKTDVIAYLGKYPELFKSKFKIHMEQQWYTGFIKEMERYFDALNWGQMNFNSVNVCLDF